MKYYKFALMTLFWTSSLLIFTYLSLYFYIYYKSDTFFIEDKYAKSIHMNFMGNHIKNFDYIFIGSSKTQNHISTNYFKKNKLNIYNYGRPSMYLTDFPYAVNEAIKLKPKNIVLNLELTDLFKQDINVKFPTQYDYDFINKAINTHFKFSSYNERLSNEIKLKHILVNILNKKTDTEINQRLKKYNLNNSLYDCNVTNYRGKVDRTVFLCSNGDSFILSNKKINNKTSPLKFNNDYINTNRLKILNSLIELIQNNGINPIIIFEPIQFNRNVKYSKAYITDRIKPVTILDFTNDHMVLEKKLWSDISHFNLYGRKKYSEKLLKLL